MVDISQKAPTTRTAIAEATLHFSNPTAATLIAENGMKKGDVLGVARIAGIMAAKKTSDLIPLCHPIMITKVSVECQLVPPKEERTTGLARGVVGTANEALVKADDCVELGGGSRATVGADDGPSISDEVGVGSTAGLDVAGDGASVRAATEVGAELGVSLNDELDHGRECPGGHSEKHHERATDATGLVCDDSLVAVNVDLDRVTVGVRGDVRDVTLSPRGSSGSRRLKGDVSSGSKKDEVLSNFGRIEITATVQCQGKTGVEMEALTAVTVAALTVYDMCKAVDKHMRIDGARVVRKEGGKSGDWSSE